MTRSTRGKTLGLVTVAALLAMTGCASGGGGAPGGGVAAEAGLVRVSAPVSGASAGDVRGAAAGSGALGLALLRQLGAKGNVAVSPASLEDALAMLLPGARGETAAEIQKLLGTGLGAERYAAALGALRRAEVAQATADHNQLSFADDLWAQQGFRLRPPYLRTLAGAFDTGVHTVDFAHDAQGAIEAINGQVSQETHGMVPTLFDRGGLDSSTVLALTDALYLHANWAVPFDREKTQAAPFHLADGTTVQTPTMTGSGGVPAGATADWQTAELPYQGGRLAMDLLLPTDPANRLPTAAQLTAALASVGDRRALVHLPRFHFSYGQELTPTLESLGMRTAFSPKADLGGIPADGTPIQVSTMVQRTRVDVDEQGTTAAAATGVGLSATAAEFPPPELSFDRPFVFLIRDTTTGQVLFLGRVTDPR
ncbi:serpin family protein [Streptacidiphilus rugosus]|uniref:serpin family protein n=1 Tax=Streptacidiphilus rugosus TaxID=405783 RepID=UPI000A0537EF|nr:serpin family protein [Streptacidiphilus rugosus]